MLSHFLYKTKLDFSAVDLCTGLHMIEESIVFEEGDLTLTTTIPSLTSTYPSISSNVISSVSGSSVAVSYICYQDVANFDLLP